MELEGTVAPGATTAAPARARHRFTALAACLSAAAGTGSWAQAPGPASLDQVVVTATSREQPIQDVQASVEVIGPAQLKAYAGTNVAEVLRQAVGVDARSAGATSSISMRGFLPNAGTPTLVLIDGLRRTDKYGVTNLNMVALEDVERIEIIRGPMSALYGADAAGGVINVITRRPGAGGNTLRASVGATDDGQRGSAIVGATLRTGDASLGHRLSVESRNQGGFAYAKGTRPDDLSGVRHLSVGYTGQAQWAADRRLRWTLEAVDQDDRRDGLVAATATAAAVPYLAFERERRYFGALQYLAGVGPGTLESTIAIGQSNGSTNRSYPTVETTDYRQTQLNLRYYAAAGAHSIVTGAGATRDDLGVSIISQRVRRDNLHALVQDEWSLGGGWKAVLGVRHDHFDLFGGSTNPRASVGWTSGALSLRAGVGSAFRAPTALEQYSSFTRGRFIILGNPDLLPEQSKSVELAAAWRTPTASVEAVAFGSRVRNLIEAVQPGTTQNGLVVSQYQNRSQAELRGLELTGSLLLGRGWSTLASYEALDAADGSTGARLTGRASATARVTARYEAGPWRVDARGRHFHDFWQADPAIRGGAPFSSSWSVVDLRVERALARDTALALGVDNIFDRRTPVNWSTTGSVTEPARRFVYLSYRQAF